MPVSEAQKRAVKKYNQKTYKDIKLHIRKEVAEQIRTHADSRGESLCGFMLRSAKQQMKRDIENEPSPPEHIQIKPTTR